METWAGDLEPAIRHFDEALVTARAVDNHRLAAAALADRAVLQLLDGQFQTAASTARDCLAESRVAGRAADGYLGRPHVALGWAAFYDLRLEEAAAELAEAQRMLEETRSTPWSAPSVTCSRPGWWQRPGTSRGPDACSAPRPPTPSRRRPSWTASTRWSAPTGPWSTATSARPRRSSR